MGIQTPDGRRGRMTSIWDGDAHLERGRVGMHAAARKKQAFSHLSPPHAAIISRIKTIRRATVSYQ